MIKQLLKSVMAHTSYRLVRDSGLNRFEAVEACLRSMRGLGFSPKVVIDGGAHLGQFGLVAKSIFPDAKFHLIEPQPACCLELRAICAENEFVFHQLALAEGAGRGFLTSTTQPSTGAHMESKSVTPVTTATLDDLFASLLHKGDRVLLKLDLQGYELRALRGGTALLPSIEIILTEVSFFSQSYEPSIADLIGFLDQSGFVLYDIAALAGRSRDNRLKQGDFIFARKGSDLLQDARWE
jgi:FkbM family methyltransferase